MPWNISFEKFFQCHGCDTWCFSCHSCVSFGGFMSVADMEKFSFLEESSRGLLCTQTSNNCYFNHCLRHCFRARYVCDHFKYYNNKQSKRHQLTMRHTHTNIQTYKQTYSAATTRNFISIG